ncbi:MAG: glutathione S-transferase family protein [Pseudomonadota bacterium]
MKLDHSAIETKEVLSWKGLHLLNFSQSSCSQKVRILLSEKQLAYSSREINLKKLEHTTSWYLGINARGVVPVLIDDGDVHIESNDILGYLDERYPSEQSWIPQGEEQAQTARELLALEDQLHPDLRVVTMGFLAPAKMMAKSEEELAAYLANGPEDAYRLEQIAWWREFGRNGINEQQAQDAVLAFHAAFSRLEQLLAGREWLVADHPTIADIAWFINIHRLVLAGYPLAHHPSVEAYYRRMLARPAFAKEISKGPLPVRLLAPLYRLYRKISGTNLGKVYAEVFNDQTEAKVEGAAQ